MEWEEIRKIMIDEFGFSDDQMWKTEREEAMLLEYLDMDIHFNYIEFTEPTMHFYLNGERSASINTGSIRSVEKYNNDEGFIVPRENY